MKKFPFYIHIILGIIWIVLGFLLYVGWETVIWVAGGLVMLLIGLLNIKKKKI